MCSQFLWSWNLWLSNIWCGNILLLSWNSEHFVCLLNWRVSWSTCSWNWILATVLELVDSGFNSLRENFTRLLRLCWHIFLACFNHFIFRLLINLFNHYLFLRWWQYHFFLYLNSFLSLWISRLLCLLHNWLDYQLLWRISDFLWCWLLFLFVGGVVTNKMLDHFRSCYSFLNLEIEIIFLLFLLQILTILFLWAGRAAATDLMLLHSTSFNWAAWLFVIWIIVISVNTGSFDFERWWFVIFVLLQLFSIKFLLLISLLRHLFC